MSFYSKIPGDPWTQAHQDLEDEVFKLEHDPNYRERILPALDAFEMKIMSLIEKYRPFAQGQKVSPVEIGFHTPLQASQESAVEVATINWSRQSKRCAGCTTDQNIRIARHPVSGLGVYCDQCFPRNRK